uniref:ABC transporter domain-containing protein n=1 Tax=Spongospora subterranea TaxID=70186 RepID=A0A0H5QYU3_9EUKA|eukprot:CRZ07110.1 hypothetical protein [Spongospora subterranea]
MATDASTEEIRTCINQLFRVDDVYRNCFARSGVFVPEFQASDTPKLIAQCSSSPKNPSEDCCSAVYKAAACQTGGSPKSVACKAMIDEVVWDTYDCPSLPASDIVAVCVGTFLLAFILWVRFTARSHGSLLWVRQLWGLLVKNWSLARRRIDRQVKAIVIALSLLGMVVALISLTGEATQTVGFQVNNTGLSLSLSFTTPDTMRTILLENLRVVAGLLFIIAFTYPIAQVILSIVQEKELMIREAMRVTGLYDGVLTLSWSLSFAVSFIPVCLALAFITHYGGIFPNFRVAILILFFWAFSVASISFCIALSVFFSNTRPAVISILVATFVASFVSFTLPNTPLSQGYTCLIAPACLGVGVFNALANSVYGSGFRAAYMGFKDKDQMLSLPAMTALMLFDALIYIIIAWYLENVLPKKIGRRLPWHFPFHKSFWTGRVPPKKTAEESDFASVAEPESQTSVEDVEFEQKQLARRDRCVKIEKLSRHFIIPGMKHQRVALDSLTLTLYEGQITSLLGHNGAGKTTLIRTLCGLIQPTSGDAKVYGNSLVHNMQNIRQSLGMCPQYDILFEDLTCYENLRLFSTLKGSRLIEIDFEIKRYISELGMQDKLHQKVKTLSGGQKRKLCVAIAFIGNSRVVFLDEPTSGMDPYSRRCTWDVLLKNRKGRVIVLTTHFMDEAEVLGDRVAILSDGRLRCAGTPLFLKTKFGEGYTLTVTLKEDEITSGPSHDALLPSQELIKSSVPDSTILSKNATTITARLPFHQLSFFGVLFKRLETISNTVDFGVESCTLEHVFLTVAKNRDDAGTYMRSSSAVDLNVVDMSVNQSADVLLHQDVRSGIGSNSAFGEVLAAMVIKRWWLTKRDRRQFLLLVLFPIVFLFLPVILPDISVVPFVEKGAHVYPKPGPAECNPRLAFDRSQSCGNTVDNSIGDCFNSAGIQDKPQYLDQSFLKTVESCSQDLRGWGYCSLIPWICNVNECCDYTNFRSLVYPCQTNIALNGGANHWDSNVYCPNRILSTITGAVNAFVKSLSILLAFLFGPSVVIAHAVMETESLHNTKFQQLVSGVRKITYWAGATIWDLSTIFVTVASACVIIAYYSGPLGSYFDGYYVTVALMAAYAFAVIPFTYWLSFKFDSAPRALSMLLVFNIATGAGLGIIAYIMKSFAITIPGQQDFTTVDAYNFSRYGLLIFPAFNLMDGLLRIQLNTLQVCFQKYDWELCNAAGTMSNAFQLLSLNFVYLVLTFLLSFIGLFWNESHQTASHENTKWCFSLRSSISASLNSVKEGIFRTRSTSNFIEDQDVVVERLRMQQNTDPEAYPLEILGMSKVYQTGKVALHELWLGVSRGECFGYLGVNGAGKTTTLKCVTGFQIPTKGTARIAGNDIQLDVYSARKHAGYCPQFDALFDVLTVEEHLKMYCRIRGVRPTCVADSIAAMQLHLYKDVPTQYLSGGNKRKLSAAIAMIGQPPVIFLDEPSTGMDPHAKRFLWSSILDTVQSTKAALVLTTHSMEECEALCSRVAILIDGRLKCLGSIQHLKTKFGGGYTIEVRSKAMDVQTLLMTCNLNDFESLTASNLGSLCLRLGDAQIEDKVLSSLFGPRLKTGQLIPAKEFLTWWSQELVCDKIMKVLFQAWPTVTLKGKHGLHIGFEIIDPSLLLSDLFSVMESVEGIEYYSISQTSLEEIFSMFALQQASLHI